MKKTFHAIALSQDHSLAKLLFEFALIVDTKGENGLFFAEISANRAEPIPSEIAAYGSDDEEIHFDSASIDHVTRE